MQAQKHSARLPTVSEHEHSQTPLEGIIFYKKFIHSVVIFLLMWFYNLYHVL